VWGHGVLKARAALSVLTDVRINYTFNIINAP
jgi:hypothetical protein